MRAPLTCTLLLCCSLRVCRGPALLLAQDWMFAISKTDEQPEEQLAAQHATGQQQQQRPAQPRQPVRFRNVIPGGALGGAAGKEPTAPASHVEELAQQQQQREEAEEQATQALLQSSNATGAAAAAAAARSAADMEAARAVAAHGPTLHQFGAMPAAAAAQPAPVQLQQPLPRRQQLAGGLQPGWQFDIRREPHLPAPASSSGQAAWPQQQGSVTTAGTPSSVRVDQFGAQQGSVTTAATPSSVRVDQLRAQQASTPTSSGTPASLLAQQRLELQQRSQEARSPAAAATIDEVLAQLRGGSRGPAAGGAGRQQSYG